MLYFLGRFLYAHIYAIYNMAANVQKKNDICNYPVIFCSILCIFYPFGTFFVVI